MERKPFEWQASLRTLFVLLFRTGKPAQVEPNILSVPLEEEGGGFAGSFNENSNFETGSAAHDDDDDDDTFFCLFALA